MLLTVNRRMRVCMDMHVCWVMAGLSEGLSYFILYPFLLIEQECS